MVSPKEKKLPLTQEENTNINDQYEHAAGLSEALLYFIDAWKETVQLLAPSAASIPESVETLWAGAGARDEARSIW